jgi:DHA1 family bicyclomycin/chloramphenicol resistance-like MFS transporter
LLGFVTAIGPASIDMYLPAFPAIERDLHAPIGAAQYTLAAWFAGLAVGQVTQGVLADRFGRRRPLIVSTAIYVLSCIACALAPSILTLSLIRFFGAVAASAAIVIPRAVVRDLADGHQAAVLMSRLMLVMGLAPILAPSLGGLLLEVASWRWIFGAMAIYGTVALVLTCLAVPDTLPAERRVRLNLQDQVARYGLILHERGFLTHAGLAGAATFAFFAYLGGSSPVFIDGFGFSPTQYAALFGACAAGLIACSQINAWLVPRVGTFAMLRWVVRLDLAAAAALFTVAFTGMHHLPAVLIPLFLFVSAHGIINPNATVGALSHHGAHAGSASALIGTWQYLLGAVSGLLVGALTDGTPRGMAALILGGVLFMVAADLFRPRPAVSARS